MGITEIIRTGIANGDSYEVINKRLADGGFNLKLVPRENNGWTEQEMKEGFNDGEHAKDAVRLADLMRKHTEYAGTTKELLCTEGKYAVTYNENGYAVKAVRQDV
nr:MAG TPA: hypothetical protein [Caudoviricetes sp.]